MKSYEPVGTGKGVSNVIATLTAPFKKDQTILLGKKRAYVPGASETAEKVVGGTVVLSAAYLATKKIQSSGGIVPAATSILKAAVPKTTKGKITATIVAPVAIGALQSKELRQDIGKVAVKTPDQLYGFGKASGDAYSKIRTGDYAGAKDTIVQGAKDNPIGALITGAAAVGTVGTAVYFGTRLLNELTSSSNSPDADKLAKEVSEEWNKKYNATDIKDLVPDPKSNSGNPDLSDTQTKLVSGSQLDERSKTAPAPKTPSTGAVNIQQNNYFGEKYIKKLALSK